MRLVVVAGLVLALESLASANGRPPLTNGIHFKPGDPHSMYVATTCGLLGSHDDGCTMNWVCEQNIGYGGEWDPKYAIGADGTIFATTYTGLRVSRDGGCSFTTATSELAPGTPNRIADIWIDSLNVGLTGLVCGSAPRRPASRTSSNKQKTTAYRSRRAGAWRRRCSSRARR